MRELHLLCTLTLSLSLSTLFSRSLALFHSLALSHCLPLLPPITHAITHSRISWLLNTVLFSNAHARTHALSLLRTHTHQITETLHKSGVYIFTATHTATHTATDTATHTATHPSIPDHRDSDQVVHVALIVCERLTTHTRTFSLSHTHVFFHTLSHSHTHQITET